MKQLWQPFKVIKLGEYNNQTILQVATKAPKEEILKYVTAHGLQGEIKFDDGRQITAEQRKKIFAIIKDFSLYTGYEAEYARQLLELAFCYECNIEPFSLSDCSLETARELINYLLDFCIENDIPLSETALERTDDIDKYLFITIKHSVCCICGKPGVIYTLDKDRNKMCLCDNHYDIAKLKGLKEFERLYKVYGIKYEGGYKIE